MGVACWALVHAETICAYRGFGRGSCTRTPFAQQKKRSTKEKMNHHARLFVLCAFIWNFVVPSHCQQSLVSLRDGPTDWGSDRLSETQLPQMEEQIQQYNQQQRARGLSRFLPKQLWGGPSIRTAKVPSQPTISNPSGSDRATVPRVFKSNRILFLIPGPCQLRCAYVRNKAHHGLTTGDLRLMAEAYQAAKHWQGIGINAGISALQVGVFVFSLVTFGVFPYGAVISGYDLAHIHGPNTVYYAQVIYYLGETLKKIVGEQEFQLLKKIKYYKSEQGTQEMQQWLERQRQRLNIPVAPSSVNPADVPQPDAETIEKFINDPSLPSAMQGMSLADSSYSRKEIFAQRPSCPSCQIATKSDWIAVTA